MIPMPAMCGQDVKDAKGSKDEDLAFAKEARNPVRQRRPQAGENHNPN